MKKPIKRILKSGLKGAVEGALLMGLYALIKDQDVASYAVGGALGLSMGETIYQAGKEAIRAYRNRNQVN